MSFSRSPYIQSSIAFYDQVLSGSQRTNNNVSSAIAAALLVQAVDRQLDLGRSLQIWLNLQNGVNALFDSTSTPQNLGTQVHKHIRLDGSGITMCVG